MMLSTSSCVQLPVMPPLFITSMLFFLVVIGKFWSLYIKTVTGAHNHKINMFYSIFYCSEIKLIVIYYIIYMNSYSRIIKGYVSSNY